MPGSKLIDAPAAGIPLSQVLPLAKDYDLVVMHTSTPSFAADAKMAAALKDVNPNLKVGFVGAKVAVQPDESLKQAPSIDFVGRNEFDFTIKEVAEGRSRSPRSTVSAIATARARSCTTPSAPCSRTWTSCRSSARSTSATSRSRTTSSAT